VLNLIICEDNEIQRRKVKDIVLNAIESKKLAIDLKLCTDSPKAVLKYLEENKDDTSIYLLDVDLNSSINGIKLAEKIREKDLMGFIIFLTTHSEMSYMTFQYKVEAMDYIIKDKQIEVKERIESCLVKAHNAFYSVKNDENILSIEADERVIKINTKDILFIESSNTIHKIKVHEANRATEFYGSLKDIEQKLPESFYRCHKAFIVNREKIKEIDKKDRVIHLINGQTCFASVRYMKGLLE